MKTFTLATMVTIALLAGAHAPAADDEPAKVRVQHILIGFKRTVPGKKLERTKAQAKALAAELAERAREGADFDALVEEYTDDRHPGIYLLTNRGAPRLGGSRMRSEMTARFGDVAFALEVGEIDVAAYSAGLSPYGWHVIKRLE